jgi:hypothetical protein
MKIIYTDLGKEYEFVKAIKGHDYIIHNKTYTGSDDVEVVNVKGVVADEQS